MIPSKRVVENKEPHHCISKYIVLEEISTVIGNLHAFNDT